MIYCTRDTRWYVGTCKLHTHEQVDLAFDSFHTSKFLADNSMLLVRYIHFCNALYSGTVVVSLVYNVHTQTL